MRIPWSWLTLVLLLPGALRSADCNRNDMDDAEDLASGTSADCNENRIPDECDLLPPARFDGAEAHRGLRVVDGALLADLDSDADLDVALTGDSIAVARNLGEGRFARPASFLAGSFARGIAAGDLDLDGDADLAVSVQFGPAVSILRNRGDASFEAPVELPTGDNPVGISLADLNQDGLLDIVTAGFRGLSLLLGEGPLEFTDATLHPGGGGSASGLSAADLDGDGFLDIVECSADLEDIVLVYNEAGRLSAPFPVRARTGLNQSVVVDLDGDTVPEIAAATDEGGAELLIVRDYGGGPATIERTALDFVEKFIVAFDPDHDGDVDLAFTHSHEAHFFPNVSVLFQQGHGSFTDASSFHFHAATLARSLSAGDLDGDALPDLVTATNGSFTVLWNGRAPLFSRTLVIRTDRDPRRMLAGDFDRDGAPEMLVTMGGTRELQAFEVSADSWTLRRAAGDFGYQSVVEKHDVDLDSDLDLVQTSGRAFVFWHNDGLGSFTIERLLYNRDASARDFEIVDLDGDEAQDIVFVGSAYVFLIRSLGGEAIEVDPEVLRPLGGTPSAIEVADMNGDGRPDLIVCDTSSNEITLLSQGEGLQFTSRPTVLGGVAPGSPFAVDLDMDGDIDVATANSGSDDVSVFGNDGSGALTLIRSVATGVEPASMTAANLNGDGRPDLVTCSAQTDSISVLLNEGSLQLRRAADLPVADDPLHVEAADMDLDGRDDLAVTSHTSGTLHFFLSKPGQATEEDCNANGSPDQCDIRAGLAEDRNENGVPDSCEAPPFRRGDPNDDGETDVSDGVSLLLFLFAGASVPGCLDAADVNADLLLDIGDAVYVLDHLFRGGSAPPAPGPAYPRAPCGTVRADASLGCEEYRSCSWVF